MANSLKETSIVCTDERYMTPNDVKVYFKTSLVDYHWRYISEYRKQHAKQLVLRDINNHCFSLTLSPAIAQKMQAFAELLKAFSERIDGFLTEAGFLEAFRKESFLPLLKTSCLLEGKDIPELTLKAMLTGMYRENDPEHAPILGHLAFLDSLLDGRAPAFEESLFASLLGKLNGNVELVSFYREKNSRSRFMTNTASEIVEECPWRLIESKMNDLFASVERENIPVIAKAFLAAYFVAYLKPFDSHNDLIASLAAKAYLANQGYGKAMAFLPLENLMRKSDKKKDICDSVQLYSDITYFVCYGIEQMTLALSSLLDVATRTVRLVLDEERNRLTPSDVGPSQESAEKDDERKPEEAGSPHEETPPQPVLPKPEETSLPEEKEKRVPEVPAFPAESVGQLALNPPKSPLSDKEIRETARYILETNPNIRKPQALFFASHCTVGSFYTIQDYKKHARCVYETARTSMDNLAKEGFYRKLKFKNKFVYTPIKQGEKA